ncbi:MAG: hypothetical protein KatS3mg027_2707 [Bacteroidia bacterium]|nr:MAG: hypothetical protein KatS3mg027_2707 [Bacteroidia bacterium]
MLWSIVLVLSCINRKDSSRIKGQRVDTSIYFSRVGSLKAIAALDSCTSTLILVNNPHNFTDNAILTIFFNSHVVYSGKFNKEVEFCVPKEIVRDLVHIKLEILEKDMLFIFEDKSAFHWHTGYPYIYCVFFPRNESSDQIHFFPQKERIIQ